MHKIDDYIKMAEDFAEAFIHDHTDKKLEKDWKKEKGGKFQLYNEICEPQKVLDKHKQYQNVSIEDARRLVHKKITQQNRSLPTAILSRRIMKYAAIFIGIVLTTSLILYLQKGSQADLLADLDGSPGASKATLILSDGMQIDLAPISSGISMKKDGVTILKDNESIIYSSDQVNKTEEEVKMNTLLVPRGGKWIMTLEDGTKIWLNSDSKLTYPSEFKGAERRVHLIGEGFFEVAHDPDHPFIVSTTYTDTKVLGTSFNIKAYPNEKVVETTLVEGIVGLSQYINNTSLVMEPGFQAIVPLDSSKMIYNSVDVSVYTAWKDGQFEFRDESLETIMNSLERWYDVDVSYSDERLKELHFTTRLKRYNKIQDLLILIEQTQKVKFAYENNQIIIKPY